MINKIKFNTPIGMLEIASQDGKITSVYASSSRTATTSTVPCLLEAKKQLLEYFDGKRTKFDIAYDLGKTSPFRLKVWREMAKVPHGKTITYATLASRAGSPKACRAAGGACHNNPLLIIVPCHRIIGADGSLTGFAAGLNSKEWLLKHEGVLK